MFKRNQVVEAIGTLLEGDAAKSSVRLRTRIRRLLETDRRFGRNKRSSDPQRTNFAFFTKDMPGRGGENWFSTYEPFALLMGLRLLAHRWPQGFAVTVMRRIRPTLEQEHARILRQDPDVLFDEQAIRQHLRPGVIAVDNTDPVFLAILSRERDERAADAMAVAVCRGQRQLMAFARSCGPGHVMTTYELVNSIHSLARALDRTKPHHRGRAP